MKRACLLLSAVLVGCTPGASGGGTQAPSSLSGVTTIDINLSRDAGVLTQAGAGGGYAPIPVVVPVGTRFRFVNTDGFAHTATAIGGTQFPSALPFTDDALTQRGSMLSQAWTTGALDAGSSSQIFVADQPGVYIFGCFFHYGAPMRGVIIVE